MLHEQVVSIASQSKAKRAPVAIPMSVLIHRASPEPWQRGETHYGNTHCQNYACQNCPRGLPFPFRICVKMRMELDHSCR